MELHKIRKRRLDKGGGGEYLLNMVRIHIISGMGLMLALLSGGICIAEAVARQPTQEAVQAWFEAEWSANGPEIPDLSGHSVTWRVEFRYVPPAAELDKLRKEVTGKPDHPDRFTLENYERALKNDPSIVRYRLWSHGKGNWRQNKEWGFGNDLSHYWDFTLTPKRAWMMLQSSMTIFSPGSPTAPGMDLPSLEHSFGPVLEQLFSAHVPTAARSGYKPGTVSLAGQKWTILVSVSAPNSDAKAALTFSGRWDDQANRGFIEEERVVSSGDTASVGKATKYLEWTHEPSLDRWVAHRVEMYKSDHRLDRVIVFENAQAEEPGEFEKITAIPPAEGEDPIRGKTTFTRVTDYRTNKQSLLDTERKEAVSASLPVQEDTGPRWQRRIGWITSLSLVMGLVAIAAHRRIKTQRTSP